MNFQKNCQTYESVIIIDDCSDLRYRIRQVLGSLSHLEVISECDNGETAINQIKQHIPDHVILDIRMPVMSGIEVLKSIQDIISNINVIILTNQTEDAYREKCLTLGANYFLDKTAEFVQLKEIFR